MVAIPILYSSDGSTFTPFTQITGRNVANFSIQNIDLSSITALNNNSNFKIKIVVDGATNASGNNRFDNIQINGTAPLSDGDGTAVVSNEDDSSLLFSKDIWERSTGNSKIKISITGTSAGSLSDASVEVPQLWGTISGAQVSLDGDAFASSSFSVSNNVITISNTDLTDTKSGNVHITSLTTPSNSQFYDDGNFVFTVKTAKSGGTATEIDKSPTAYVTISIANIRDEQGGVPNLLNKTVAIYGVVTGINGSFSTTGTDNFLQDYTGGVNIYRSSITNLTLDNNYYIKGQVIQFQGLTEVNPASAADMIDAGAGVTIVGDVLSPTFASNNGSKYEGSVVIFQNASLTSGTWPATALANNTVATLTFTNSNSETFTVYVDAETEIDGTAEPSWPKDLRGIYTDKNGYGLLLRTLDDIAPNNSLPVELTSFTVTASGNGANLAWSTATETNNAGWNVERANGNQWQTIGFVSGKGTTTAAQSYSFTDSKVIGKVQYRLKQVDNNGNYTYSNVLAFEVLPTSFEVLGNYPNPFNPSTMLRFTLPQTGKVRVVISNVLGQQVAVVADREFNKGTIDLPFSAANLSSGMYYYTITANGKSVTKTMMLMK